MNMVPDLPADGEARKQAAHRLLESHRERLFLRARRALLTQLLSHGTATIDDVRAAVAIPAGINPKLFGTVPGPLAALRIIRQAGSRRTTRAIGHARPVTIWELTDATAAAAWLRDHPDVPDPKPSGSTYPAVRSTPAASLFSIED